MKNKNILFLFIFALFNSCGKKQCTKCYIHGSWAVEQIISTFSNNELSLEQISNFDIELFEDGTGLRQNDEIFWTLTPDNQKIFISINIIGDTLHSTELFDIINLGDDELIWHQEESFGVNHLREKEWILKQN